MLFTSLMGICNVSQAMAIFRPGTTFWTLESLIDQGPTAVLGPCLVEKYDWPVDVAGGSLGPRVYYQVNGQRFGSYVGDLTNRWHGMFGNEQEAHEHFAAFQRACVEDPVLVADLKRLRQILDSDADGLCEELDENYDDNEF